ncbi:MAG TPA: macrolide ABC transporter ATP-binding protein [Rhodospirillaceae bacterium]|nr:MAG: macrolide ABC transporter ATP-binding protein [Alphaproteobacteria bacterium GWF2_58_20]HAU28634.1 macrolide ABC transporter ATP-binding protein [Rhodospirillaceae bacterium]
MDALVLENVSKNYVAGDVVVPALSGVDLIIPAGGFVAMAGPSGSGKSTLLNLAGALDVPTEGRVLVEGHDLSGLTTSEQAALRRDRIGFVFQNYNLVPVLTALENAEYVLMLRGVGQKERRERARALLAEIGLGGMENRFPRQLSGGQQQRVAIARAILAEPAIVLADEPTANVDSRTASDLLALMEKLHADRGVTFLFSTHDLDVMRRAGRLVWLRDGRIFYDGKPDGFEIP